MRKVLAASLSLFIVLVAAAGWAVAEPNGDASIARSHFEKGTRLFQVGDYRQALVEFRAAHVAKPDPAFLWNIGQCHRQLGELPEALTMYAATSN